MAKKNAASSKLANELRERSLARYPGAHLKSPWPGHLDLAVKDKTFAYLSVDDQPFHISCKLPRSGPDVLMLPNAAPAGYGLGKSGWVEVSFADDDLPPREMIEAWIEESYRAQAPKKLVAELDGATGTTKKKGDPKKNGAPEKKSAPKKSAPKKSAPKKTAPKKTAARR